MKQGARGCFVAAIYLVCIIVGRCAVFETAFGYLVSLQDAEWDAIGEGVLSCGVGGEGDGQVAPRAGDKRVTSFLGRGEGDC